MHSKLLFDHAGEWYRTAKSIQEDQILLRIRSTPMEAEQTGYMNSKSTEPEKAESHTPAIPSMVRDCVMENSLENISPEPVQLTLPRLDTHPRAPFDSKSEDREEITEPLCTDGIASLEIPEKHEGGTPYTPASCKSTRKNFGKPASSFSDFYM